jgi:bifunctional non-homologous end joining protein LigD
MNALDRLVKHYPEVQLATLVDQPPEGDEWLHEIKLDGYRLLGFVSGHAACLRTRNGKDWTEKFPSVVAALETLKADDAVVDMEAVVLNSEGKSSFQALQADASRIVAYVFDLLHLDGEDLSNLPLTKRKEKLKSLLTRSRQKTSLRYSEHIVGEGNKLLAKACASDLEGVVSKKADAPYMPGRQNSWLKSKCAQRQEFIILGSSKARTGVRALGALYLGYRKNAALQYAGKVGTGFSMKSARELADRLEKLAVDKPTLARSDAGGIGLSEWQSIRWVKPVLICEVAFTEWTQDGHIRHPSFQGLRQDKNTGEVKRETPWQQQRR